MLAVGQIRNFIYLKKIIIKKKEAEGRKFGFIFLDFLLEAMIRSFFTEIFCLAKKSNIIAVSALHYYYLSLLSINVYFSDTFYDTSAYIFDAHKTCPEELQRSKTATRKTEK